MILRRLSQSLKEQNWTAIWIEFVLLVAGVFLGMQVQDWNSDRQDRARAVILSERLRQDLEYERWNYQYVKQYYAEVLANAGRAVDALSGDAPMTDEQFLISAYRATQFVYFPRRQSTYEELIATGSIKLIADQQLRTTAISVFNDTTLDINQTKARDSDYRREFRRATPARIQQALLRQCGDRFLAFGDFQNIVGTLDYPCELSVPQNEISAAATALRHTPALLPALRERFADLQSAGSDLTNSNNASWPTRPATEEAK